MIRIILDVWVCSCFKQSQRWKFSVAYPITALNLLVQEMWKNQKMLITIFFEIFISVEIVVMNINLDSQTQKVFLNRNHAMENKSSINIWIISCYKIESNKNIASSTNSIFRIHKINQLSIAHPVGQIRPIFEYPLSTRFISE